METRLMVAVAWLVLVVVRLAMVSRRELDDLRGRVAFLELERDLMRRPVVRLMEPEERRELRMLTAQRRDVQH